MSFLEALEMFRACDLGRTTQLGATGSGPHGMQFQDGRLLGVGKVIFTEISRGGEEYNRHM